MSLHRSFSCEIGFSRRSFRLNRNNQEWRGLKSAPLLGVIPKLWSDAEDAPHPTIELERLEIPVQVITRDVELAARPILGKDIKVIRWAVTHLGALPFGERIRPQDGRAVGVRLLLPDVAMDGEDTIALVPLRV